jgi:hypothetical protein
VAVLHRRLRSRQRGSTFVERLAHHKRVLSRGCYPFLSGRSENLSVFLASLSASTKGVIATANRSAFALSQSLTTPFAVPSLVSKTVILVTGVFIPKTIFKINFLGVLFFRLMIFFDPSLPTCRLLADLLGCTTR